MAADSSKYNPGTGVCEARAPGTLRRPLTHAPTEGRRCERNLPGGRRTEPGGNFVRIAPSCREAVREAYECFATKRLSRMRISAPCASYVVPAVGKTTYAIRVRTDGDDGYLEVYDEKGKFLAAGRTCIEVVAWGSRGWLLGERASPASRPRNCRTPASGHLWGKSLPKAVVSGAVVRRGFVSCPQPPNHPLQPTGAAVRPSRGV